MSGHGDGLVMRWSRVRVSSRPPSSLGQAFTWLTGSVASWQLGLLLLLFRSFDKQEAAWLSGWSGVFQRGRPVFKSALLWLLAEGVPLSTLQSCFLIANFVPFW